MISFPFDSQITGTDAAGLPIYDRASSSEELARLLHSFFTDGIFGGSGFAVTVSGLTVTVAPGSCLIQGRYGYEPDARKLTISPGGSLPRIDAVVLRLDMSLNMRKIDLYIRKGEELSAPVMPSMERNSTVWELGIANIAVAAGATSVNQSAVTDTRLYSVRCGVVAQAMKTIDTTTFYNQIQAELAEFKANEEAAFEQWFADLQATLSEDAAGNLYNLINQRLPLAGGTMTGVIRFNRGGTESPVYSGSMGIGSTGNVYMEHTTDNVQDNYLVLSGEETRLGKPLGIGYGGTGATTAAQARAKLGAPGISVRSITLPANWKGNAAIIGWNVLNGEGSKVLLIPDSADYDHFMDCRVRVGAVGAGTLTLVATTNPTQEMTMTLIALDHPVYLTGGDLEDTTPKEE